MAIGIGYALDGVSRGMNRRRAIDIDDENREIALSDRERRQRQEDEDRGISVPLAKSNAETAISKNQAYKQVLPGETENTLKGQKLKSGELDYQANTQGKRQAIDTDKMELEGDTVAAQRQALPDKAKLDSLKTKEAIGATEHAIGTQKEKLMRQDEIERMQYDTMQMENELAKILQGPKTAQAEAMLAETQHKIYGNIYTIAKSDPARAAQMVNDVKSNGIDNAASVTFAEGKMRIVDADGNVLSDPEYGPAEFNVDDMESAFGAKAEKGTFKAQDGIILDTRNGAYTPLVDEDGKPIKDGDTTKLERYIQNDIWRRAGDTFGAKLGDDFSFSGEGARYATEAQTRAFQYYKENGDGDLTTAWQRAFEEVQAKKSRDEVKGDLPGAKGFVSDADYEATASKLQTLFPETDRNPAEMSEFMSERGIKSLNDRIETLKTMGFYVEEVDGSTFVDDGLGQVYKIN